MQVLPADFLRGEVALPGDKSISHRSAILTAMAGGASRIENFSASADCTSTLECLSLLGIRIERDGTSVIVNGVGKKGFIRPAVSLDCGNSGTTMRLLCGVLAGQTFDSVLTGDDSLVTRPMRRVVTPLESMGAKIDSRDGNAPLHIFGKNPLRAASVTPEVASAQIKSAILLAGLNSDGATSVIEATPTRDHTERMLEWLGVQVNVERLADKTKITVSGNATLAARDILVPGDISAATFFMVAAACLPHSEIVMKNVGINGSRRAVIDILIMMGANIEISNERESCNEPVGDLWVRSGISDILKETIVIDGNLIPGLIDEIPALAVFGTQLDSGLEIRDAAELRVKESDRITTVVENLKRMGAGVEEFPDGFRVMRSKLSGARVDSAGDHRIAMAFAVAGLMADGITTIEGAECCDVSFPGFFDAVKAVSRISERDGRPLS